MDIQCYYSNQDGYVHAPAHEPSDSHTVCGIGDPTTLLGVVAPITCPICIRVIKYHVILAKYSEFWEHHS